MKQTERPIAVFDSGVGGISVLRELVRLMPNENYIWWKELRRGAETDGMSCETPVIRRSKSSSDCL